jgi:transposase
MRFVLVREVVVAVYELKDENAQRTVWVQMFQAGHVTQGQIAEALGVSLRTVNGWVARYRIGGVKGLMSKPLLGKQADEEKAALILRLRAAGKKIREIVVEANVSRATVNRVLGRDRDNGQQTMEFSTGSATGSAEETSAATNGPIPAATDSVKGEEISKESAAQPGAASSTFGVSGTDRSQDRAKARQGLLEEAQPVFAAGQNLPWVGVFLALALVGKEPLLSAAQKCFQSLGAAFYGLRTVMLTMVLLALLRIKRPEHLRSYDGAGLGRVLGLDRAPEVKTLRGKMHEISEQGHAMEFLEELARERVERLQEAPRVVYLDGHVSVYSGEHKIGEVYSTRNKQVVKGTTQTWVNLPGRCPLFCVTSEFNEGLVSAMPGVLKKAVEICDSPSVLAVFDRGGHSGLLFEKLLQAGHHFLTYRRGDLEPWPLERFTQTPTVIGGRTYEYAPAEAAVEIPVYEAIAESGSHRGAPRKVNTGRKVAVREIRVIRPDGGQTAVLVSQKDLPATEACAVLFGRWGAQENMFKYLLAEYDLDATVEYGQEAIKGAITHPNPEYVRCQKRIAKKVAQRNRLLGKLGVALFSDGISEEKLRPLLDQWSKKPSVKKALELQRQIERLGQELAKLPARVSVQTSGFQQLKTQMKLLTIGVKLSAYYIETQLVDLVAPFYPNHAKEGRKLIVAALKSPGSIRLEPGQIRVQLARQSAPCRTRAIAQLCQTLNQLHPVYPGTSLRIVFDPPVH